MWMCAPLPVRGVWIKKKHLAAPRTMGENNNVVKSDKWCLEIVNNDESDSEISAVEPSFLNIGKTTIGRNIKADLITDSEFASRNHCFIELNDSDELFLTDSVSMYWLRSTSCLHRTVGMCWLESAFRMFDVLCFLLMELFIVYSFALSRNLFFFIYVSRFAVVEQRNLC